MSDKILNELSLEIMGNRKLTIISTVAFCCISAYCLAQPTTGDPGGNATPITGVEILLGLGALFGVKKIFTFNKRDTKI